MTNLTLHLTEHFWRGHEFTPSAPTTSNLNVAFVLEVILVGVSLKTILKEPCPCTEIGQSRNATATKLQNAWRTLEVSIHQRRQKLLVVIPDLTRLPVNSSFMFFKRKYFSSKDLAILTITSFYNLKAELGYKVIIFITRREYDVQYVHHIDSAQPIIN